MNIRNAAPMEADHMQLGPVDMVALAETGQAETGHDDIGAVGTDAALG